MSLVCENALGLKEEALSSSTSSSPLSPAAAATTAAVLTATAEDTLDEEFDVNLERSRLARMYFLQQHVLDTLGWDSPPSIDQATKQRILASVQTPVYVSNHKHCYYPTCDVPEVEFPDYINRTLWFDTSSRNIKYYFHISTNTDTDVAIKSAVVRLHLKKRKDCTCASDFNPSTSRLHIKIYQYKKPVRSHARLRHSNMRLIDVKMISWDSARWVSLQVTDAVKRISSREQRNSGFEVHIQDIKENVLEAKSVIDPIVCSSKNEYDCSNESFEDDEESDENLDPNFSPRLEITTTVTSRLEISDQEQDQEQEFE